MSHQDLTWKNELLQRLEACGAAGAQTAVFLRQRQTRLFFRRYGPAVGALWTPLGSIHLNARYFSAENLNEPRLLSLLVHEARHLQQGPLTALSIYGELDAWQVDFLFQRELTGRFASPQVDELCALPLILDRQVLRRAQALMLAHAGPRYRADLLPLYPLPLELRWRLGLG